MLGGEAGRSGEVEFDSGEMARETERADRVERSAGVGYSAWRGWREWCSTCSSWAKGEAQVWTATWGLWRTISGSVDAGLRVGTGRGRAWVRREGWTFCHTAWGGTEDDLRGSCLLRVRCRFFRAWVCRKRLPLVFSEFRMRSEESAEGEG